jgi:hypothetical protein
MTNEAGNSQIWEKQPYDSESGYRYFLAYYIQSESKTRSYIQAYNEYRAERKKKPVESIPGNWRLWCSGVDKKGKRVEGRHTWAERYEAYEKFLSEEKRKALHGKILEDASNWAAMQESALEDERDFADRIYKVAEAMLKFPLFNRRTKVMEGGTQLIIEPAGWKLADISTLLRLASDLKRRGLLMPPQGAIPEDSWRSTLLQLGLDPDDPREWLDYLSAESAGHGEDATGGPDD